MQKKIVSNDILIPELVRLVEGGSQVTFVPKGSSMVPFIRGERDCVVLARPDEVDVLDIVLARINATYVIHRIISMDGEAVTLMGDGNISGVEYCRRSDILAKVIVIVRGDRRIECTGWGHRAKARAWMSLLPLRRYILAIYRRLTR